MAAALSGALLLGLGLWLWRDSYWTKGLAALCIIAAVGLGAWRGAPDPDPTNADHNGRVAWSADALQALRDAGQPVFVDVTADWCITCIANEQAVLYTEEVTAAFAQAGVVYMVADWTNYNPDIAAMLRQQGRTGIPLYLLYPGDPSQPPITLPQLLTKATVLRALDALSGSANRVASSHNTILANGNL
jgi:thiol:disulfide interchange protein DsbD